MNPIEILGLIALVFGAPAAPFAVRHQKRVRAERVQAAQAERDAAAAAEQAQRDAAAAAEQAERDQRAAARTEQAEREAAAAATLRDRAPIIAERGWLQYTGEVRDQHLHAISSAEDEVGTAQALATSAADAHEVTREELPSWLRKTHWQRAVLIAAALAVPVIVALTSLDYKIFRATNEFSTAVLYAPLVTVLFLLTGVIFGWAVGWHRDAERHNDLGTYWRAVAAAACVATVILVMAWLWHIAPRRSEDKVAAVTQAEQTYSGAVQQNSEDKARGRAQTYSASVLQSYHDEVTQAQGALNSAAALDRGSVLIAGGVELVCVESAMLAEAVLNERRHRHAAKDAADQVVQAQKAVSDAKSGLKQSDHGAVHAIFDYLTGLEHPDPAQPLNIGVQNAEQLIAAIDERVGLGRGDVRTDAADPAGPADLGQPADADPEPPAAPDAPDAPAAPVITSLFGGQARPTAPPTAQPTEPPAPGAPRPAPLPTDVDSLF